MELITIAEMMDYVADCRLDGYRLSPAGLGAAEMILARRADWTADHRKMLDAVRTAPADAAFPHKLARLVSRTRLGDALELAWKITRETRRNRKGKLRRKAAKARRAAMNRATAQAAMEAQIAA